LFLVTALLIKLTSPGPVFFIQERVGLNKRRFRLFKFRTMVQGAEQRLAEVAHLNEVSGPVFKIKNDPRLTRLGKLLRKTSIDELPQLFNVLKGDMSLVGPRPLPVRDYKGFDQDWQRRRFSVRRASPASGKSTAEAPLHLTSGWNSTCTISITGPWGWTSRY
jgi:lipopolysaccharide/colanic/teichoic acid biosynthesis glycosyltransferase